MAHWTRHVSVTAAFVALALFAVIMYAQGRREQDDAWYQPLNHAFIAVLVIAVITHIVVKCGRY